MKKNRKLLGGFVALLHICLIAFPLLVLGYNVAYRTIQSNQSYTERKLISEEGQFQEVQTKMSSTYQVGTGQNDGNLYPMVNNYYKLLPSYPCDWNFSIKFTLVSGYIELFGYDELSFDEVYFDYYIINDLTISYYLHTYNDDHYYFNLINENEDYYSNIVFSFEEISYVSDNLIIKILDITDLGLDDSYEGLFQLVDYYEISYVPVEDNSITTEVTYSFEDNSYLGLRDTLYYFNVLDSNLTFDNVSWNDCYSDLNSFSLLMDVDYLSVFDLGSENSSSLNSVLAFVNFYFNWIINMSIVVFVPEMLIVFIDICRKLIYSFSHKIEGGY